MKNFIIITLSTISLLLTGYIIYDKVLSENKENTIIKEDNNIQKDTNNSENNIDISDNENSNNNNNQKIDIYENIITKDLSKLLSKKSLSELSNQDVLYMLVEMYKNKFGFPETFTKEDLDNVHKNSVLRNIKFEHENISDYSIVHEYPASPLFDYNNNTYKYAKTGHSYETLKIINKELVEVLEKDNEIILSYKFIFLNQSENNPTYLKLYSTINDVKNNKTLKEYSYYDVYDEASNAMATKEAKLFIELNYNDIKENLETYTYIFKNENENIILKDFYKK